MNGPGIQRIVCRRCFCIVDAADRFCRQCGEPLTVGGNDIATPCGQRPIRAEVVPAASSGVATKWAQNPWVVLGALFLVLGPLGLPMLWRSDRFSLFWKLLLTALVVGLTALLLGMIWYVTYKSLAPLRELQQLRL
jgi:hypothetical protein